jgi:hypothetical protein
LNASSRSQGIAGSWLGFREPDQQLKKDTAMFRHLVRFNVFVVLLLLAIARM